MKIITNNAMPKTNGHYSMCTEHNGLLFIAGQLPIQGPNKQIPNGISNQTQLVLEKIDTILEAAGSSKNNVLQVRIYLSDIELWDDVNKVYAQYFKDHKPVRAVVPTGPLHYGCLIEIEATAAVIK